MKEFIGKVSWEVLIFADGGGGSDMVLSAHKNFLNGIRWTEQFGCSTTRAKKSKTFFALKQVEQSFRIVPSDAWKFLSRYQNHLAATLS
jgi:hypothetical protein